MASAHIPVLLRQSVDLLDPHPGDSVLDVTAGLGGHSRAFLERIGNSGRLILLDADADNLAKAVRHVDGGDRVMPIHANFRQLPGCLPEDRRTFDVVFADLGLSSPHIDDPERGFTFRSESAPLDMRYDRRHGSTAADLLEDFSQEEIATMLQTFGEVPHAFGLAKAVIAARAMKPIKTTGQLTALIKERYGYKAPSVTPQVFQALRIAVNRELDALESFLVTAPQLLSSGGRLGIISYHSLEDRMVKHRFRELATPLKDALTGAVATPAEFALLERSGIAPDDTEVTANPRSRSARLRAITRVSLYTSA